MACLENIGLPYLYSTLELFIQWIKDGTYDFHRLPIAMKRHLNEEDKQILEEVVNSQHYAGGYIIRKHENYLLYLNAMIMFSSSMIHLLLSGHCKSPFIIGVPK